MIVVEQIRGARAMLGLKQDELAKKAGISTGTLNNIERGVQLDPKSSTLRAIQKALELEGVTFIEHDGNEVGLRLRARKKEATTLPLLIIDDNVTDRKLYKIWLTKQPNKNYLIFEAGNAKEGYETFLAQRPACILLDYMMYGTNGFQLLIEMKKGNVEIPPIIFVTATYNDAIRRDVLAQGAHTYLDKKNLTKEKLYETVSKAIGE